MWRELYDLAVRAGIQSFLDKTAKEQVSGLLEMVWYVSDKDRYFDSNTLVSEMILYMARQAARNKFSKYAIKYLIRGLRILHDNNAATPQNIARFIGFYRWVYEACKGLKLYNIKRYQVSSLTMDDFVKYLESIRQSGDH